MGIETGAAKTAHEGVKAGVSVVESFLRKVWSMVDAASEKKMPGEVLSPKAIGAIQGKPQG
jgi:hypothetical protein